MPLFGDGKMIIGENVHTSEKERFFVALDGTTIMLTEVTSDDPSTPVIWDYLVMAVLAADRHTGQPVMQIMPLTPYPVIANPNAPLLEIYGNEAILKLKNEYSKIKTQLRAARSGIVTSTQTPTSASPKGMSLGNPSSLS